jgi:hypothetical protein
MSKGGVWSSHAFLFAPWIVASNAKEALRATGGWLESKKSLVFDDKDHNNCRNAKIGVQKGDMV